MKRRYAVSAAFLGTLIACSAGIEPARGGLMLTIAADGAPSPDQIKVNVTSEGVPLFNVDFSTAQTPFPNTLSIVTNGSATTTATISVSAWSGGIPLDRRDAIVTQIPTDRVASMKVLLSSKCSALVRVGEDGTAVSTCNPGFTCEPSLGTCVSVDVDASALPTYGSDDLSDASGIDGSSAIDAPSNADSGSDATTDAISCAAPSTCPHEFIYHNAAQTSVEVRGDFGAPTTWVTGIPMTVASGGNWSAIVPVPYGKPVQYKFFVNGSTWQFDPAQPTIDDGTGGTNNYFAGATCVSASCE